MNLIHFFFLFVFHADAIGRSVENSVVSNPGGNVQIHGVSQRRVTCR